MDLSHLAWHKRSFVLTVCWLSLLAMLLAGCGGDGPVNSSLSGAPTSTAVGGGQMNLAPQPVPGTPTPPPLPTVPVHSGSASLPPGSILPTEAQCAASVPRSSFEPRPANAVPNARIPTAQQLASVTHWGSAGTGQSSQADTLRQQITGNYTGTTDEILQWVACKWGFDPNIVRAQAVDESYWRQLAAGDYTNNRSLCPPGTWNGTGCYQTYGILQIKYTIYPSTWPMSHYDTAFSAEFMYGEIRACFEGWDTYLQGTGYHAGDLWGCIGRWYSGGWYDSGAVWYINKVKSILAEKTWLQQDFAGA